MDSNWDRATPHIRIQMYPGRDEDTKKKLTQSISACVQNVLAANEGGISVAIEEIKSENWTAEVVEKEFEKHADTITKWPNYYHKK